MPYKPPKIILALSDEDIYQLGVKNFNSSEELVLKSIGLKENHLKGVKANKRWRYNYDKGTSEGMRTYNQGLAESRDSSIQKEIAKTPLKPAEVIEEGFEFEIDCSPQFRKGISKGR